MHRFTIRPIKSSRPSIDIHADDAAAVLQFLECTDCKAAHVDRDGQYAFSLYHGEDGVWQIRVENPGQPRLRIASSGK